MKKMFSVLGFVLMVSIPLFSTAQRVKRDQHKEIMVAQMIRDKKFVFNASSVMSFRGFTQQLTSLYDLRVAGDSVISDLPYFGRAYVAPMNVSEGGIHVTSASNEYTAVPRRKGGWDVSIVPSDKTEVRKFNLTVFSSGYATLLVTSTNRDPITFYGYLSEYKQ